VRVSPPNFGRFTMTQWQVQMPGAERLFRVDIRTLKIFTSTWAMVVFASTKPGSGGSLVLESPTLHLHCLLAPHLELGRDMKEARYCSQFLFQFHSNLYVDP